MTPLTEQQIQIAENICPETGVPAWRDWRWQIKQTVRRIASFERLLGITFTQHAREKLQLTTARFPLAVTPYYLSLIDSDNYENDPIFRQCFPSPAELRVASHDMADPLAEDKDSPAPGITHRYPDRVLFHVSNMCAMYCRHCTRKRKVGDVDFIPSRKELEAGIDYIKETSVIRDVLISGGDPLMLSDSNLEWLLTQIRDIKHVEVIRIGTRMPVVLPYRITDKLVSMLSRYHPLWLNTHFNHPRELTKTARAALAKLANAGIPLGNQSVLLADVNDCPRIMKALVHKLVRNRVRPYYLYQCDLAEGLEHFRTPIGKGMEIIESLVGHTSGFARPTYVIDAPGGGGKIPVMPNYIVTWSTNKVVVRNYEGVITTYKEPESYKPIFCNRNCKDCSLQLNLNEADEDALSTGIAKLLADWEEDISLIPEGTERFERREDDNTESTDNA